MDGTTARPKLLIPQLRKFYDWAEPVSWLILRATAGLMLISHGWPKWTNGIEWTAAIVTKRTGISPPEPIALLLMMNEIIGAICITLGLFTRFFAASVAIEMAVIVYIFRPTGGPPYESVLMWCLLAFAIALRGGGPYSLDNKIGREL
jgi:putative oxidoreductase